MANLPEESWSSRTCESCSTNAAIFSCLCSGKKAYICSSCLSAHMLLPPVSSHMPLPLSLENIDFSAYQRRAKALEVGHEALKSQIEKIDQSCHDLTEAVDVLIGQLTETRDNWIRQLQAWKATLRVEISKSVMEVQSVLFKEEAQLREKYSEFLRSYPPKALELFSYSLDALPVSSAIKSLFQAECPPASPAPRSKPEEAPKAPAKQDGPRLARLGGSGVSLFDFSSESWSAPISVSIKYDSRSSYTLLSAEKLFCCGSKRHADSCTLHAATCREAYILYLGEQQVQVEELPPMNHQRCTPGLLGYKQSVFVFGSGVWGTIQPAGRSSVEVFAAPRWTLLPQEMSCRRFFFTPCEFEGRAYLFDPFTPANIDILDLASRSFEAPRVVKLPKEDYGCVCAIVNGALLIICQSYTARLSPRSGAPVVIKHKQKEPRPASNAVVVGDWVYWVDSYGFALKGGEREIVTLGR